MEYKELASYEISGSKLGLGLKILVSIHREFTDNDIHACSKAASILMGQLQRETVLLDPQTIIAKQSMRTEIVALFPFYERIYVEEIPNGYCAEACCISRPWFVITTHKGRIKIGWRKRVMEINWTDSQIEEGAWFFFPHEDTTRIEKTIHAWSYEKAKEYIGVLLK